MLFNLTKVDTHVNNSKSPISTTLVLLEGIFPSEDKCSEVTVETLRRGDSRHESVRLQVIRLIQRKKNQSMVVNKTITEQVIRLFDKAQLINKIERLSGHTSLSLLRMQFNIMETGDFVGWHNDLESDPAYKVIALLKFPSSHKGGALTLRESTERHIDQPERTIFLMNPGIEHCVQAVTEGKRYLLAMFLG
jgi:hypothetical protein